ncbi:MAG: ABC transporter ATP-binding protein [Firmicutes bacterium]|jgi:ABC-2 type transport system ATP-binding protein|nr:ABC transporter ATP-binding protein [Bacillota bacterium]
MAAIEMRGVQKSYYLARALDGIDLSIEPGKIVGLLGPNGAGKSTLLKLCAGLIHPTAGSVRVLGQEVSLKTKARTAFVPEIDTFYGWMTVSEALRLEASMFADIDPAEVTELLRELKLDARARIAHLSKGMRAKLKLVAAMSRKADLVLMDEPLAGIDPPARAAILETIATRYRPGEQTIVISTHEVLESEKLFDDVVFLSGGRIALQGNADQLRVEKGKSLNEVFAEVC